jgi:hypothetical protein
MDGLVMNANIQFVIQNYHLTHYHVLDYQKENVYHRIIVFVIQDIHHLIVLYIIVTVTNIMIQQFVLEMVIVFQLKLAHVIMAGLMKIVKLNHVIQFLLMYQQFVMEMEIVVQLIIVIVMLDILENIVKIIVIHFIIILI